MITSLIHHLVLCCARAHSAVLPTSTRTLPFLATLASPSHSAPHPVPSLAPSPLCSCLCANTNANTLCVCVCVCMRVQCSAGTRGMTRTLATLHLTHLWHVSQAPAPLHPFAYAYRRYCIPLELLVLSIDQRPLVRSFSRGGAQSLVSSPYLQLVYMLGSSLIQLHWQHPVQPWRKVAMHHVTWVSPVR